MVKNISWSILASSQALLMLYGLPPTDSEQTIIEMKKIFVDKEKMLQSKYINTFENIVRFFKDYQHGEINEIKGKEIDKFIESSEEYLERINEIKVIIEKRKHKEIIEQIYQDVFELLETFVEKKSQDKMTEDFENNFIKKGIFSAKNLRTLKEIIKIHSNLNNVELDVYIVEELRKKAINLTNNLIQYNQKIEIINKKRSL